MTKQTVLRYLRRKFKLAHKFLIYKELRAAVRMFVALRGENLHLRREHEQARAELQAIAMQQRRRRLLMDEHRRERVYLAIRCLRRREYRKEIRRCIALRVENLKLRREVAALHVEQSMLQRRVRCSANSLQRQFAAALQNEQENWNNESGDFVFQPSAHSVNNRNTFK